MNTIKLKKNALFNPEGDTDLRHRRMIGGNFTTLCFWPEVAQTNIDKQGLFSFLV